MVNASAASTTEPRVHHVKSIRFGGVGLLTSALVLGACLGGGSSAQARTVHRASTAARAHRDFAGVWNMGSYRSSTIYSTRERVATDINGNPPPLQPWAAALLEKRLKDADEGRIFANNGSRCLPQGLPQMMFEAVNGPIQIFQSDQQITILSEEMSELWMIYLNAQHPKELDPNYHGDSVAHWEGDTLVIDTIGFDADKTTIDQVGTPHSDALHLITRLRAIDKDHLEFHFTIDDPKAFTHSWERKIIYNRTKPGTRVEEYVCENLRNGPDANGFQDFKK
jgi:hypothetical protein